MEIMRQSLTYNQKFENSYQSFELLNGRKPCFETLFDKLFQNVLPKVATRLVFLTSPVRVTASLLMLVM